MFISSFNSVMMGIKQKNYQKHKQVNELLMDLEQLSQETLPIPALSAETFLHAGPKEICASLTR